MSSFNANSQMYNISTESEVANILSHFNSEYIISIVEYSFANRISDNVLPMPNIVNSIEQNFKDIKSTYTSSTDKVEAVRLQTYKEIIDTICRLVGASFNYSDDIDLYSAAVYVYDFFICNYYQHMVYFLSNYLYKERNGIYDALHLHDLKKNKDSSTIYGKKVYKDIKLAVINANLEHVLSNIRCYDIDISNILYTVYDKSIAMFLSSIVNFNPEFFRMAYMSILDTPFRATLITSIRFEIQRMSTDIIE